MADADLGYDELTFDSEFIPEDDHGPRLNATVWTLTAVSGLFLGLRVYCKLTRRKMMWMDDHVLVASWLSLVLLASFNSASVAFGFGKHSWQIQNGDFAYLLLHGNLAGTFSIIAVAWSKTSFALTLLRLAADRPYARYFLWFCMVSINLALGGAVLVTWAQCTPVERVWRGEAVPGTCWDKSVHIEYNVFAAVYSGIMDLVLALVPWALIWRLTLTRKEKIGMLVAMSMGVAAAAVSFVKISTLYAIGHNDIYETVNLVIWGAAESAVTMVAASLPVLRVFFLVHIKQHELDEPGELGTEEKSILRRLDFFNNSRGTRSGTTSSSAAAAGGGSSAVRSPRATAWPKGMGMGMGMTMSMDRSSRPGGWRKIEMGDLARMGGFRKADRDRDGDRRVSEDMDIESALKQDEVQMSREFGRPGTAGAGRDGLRSHPPVSTSVSVSAPGSAVLPGSPFSSSAMGGRGDILRTQEVRIEIRRDENGGPIPSSRVHRK